MPFDDGRTRAWIYDHARVELENGDAEGIRIVAWMNAKAAGKLRTMLADGPDGAAEDEAVR